jgi:hypothetical protein
MSREQIYKFTITCRFSDKCGQANVVYEATGPDEIPDGWKEHSYNYYGEDVVNHYCAACWKEHCEYMIERGCNEYEYRIPK